MKNFISSGSTVDYEVPSGTVKSGDMILVGSLFGVAATDGESGEVITLYLSGMFNLPKAAGAVEQGDPLYFDGSAGVLTTTAGELDLVAIAGQPAAAGDDSVYAIISPLGVTLDS